MSIESAKKSLDLKKNDVEFWKNKVDELERELQVLITNGDFSSETYISKTRESTRAKDILNLIYSILDDIKRFDESNELLDDDEMKELALKEIQESEENAEINLKQLNILNSIKLKYDENRAIFEIRPGVGGIEASLFAESLFEMYRKFFTSYGYKIEIFNIDYETEGGIKEAVFLINTDEAYGFTRFEAGVHRVQRVPTTESAGRIHTSTASVVVLPEIKTKDIDIKEEDLRIDVYRSSGPGGQSVNTTDSAVRITHIPSGISIACQQGKSQHKNKEMALSILKSKLIEIEDQKNSNKERSIRQNAIAGGDRSAKIRTYNFPQGRITDHRVHKTWYNIDAALSGDIGDIISYVSSELRAEIEKDSAR